MAINKKLIHFKTKQKFDEELAKGNILNTSIVFILDSKEIYTHGQYYGDLSECLTKYPQEFTKEEKGQMLENLGYYFIEWDGESETMELSEEEYAKLSASTIPLLVAEGMFFYPVSFVPGFVIMFQIDSEYSSVTVSVDLTSPPVLKLYMNTINIPSKTSDLENDSNFISSDNLKTINGESIIGEGNIIIPTKVSELENDANYITTADIPSLDEYVTETELTDKGYLTEHQDISHLAEKSEIPTKVSKLENDANYILDGVFDGVYAVDANGELIDYNTADATALGVALVAGEHKFMIAKADAINDDSDYLYWTYNTSDLSLTNYSKVDRTNSYGYLPKPDGTFSGSTHVSDDFTTWTAGALSDFNGKANTAVIAASSSDAKDMCTVLNTFNASDSHNDWYVPTLGQLALMYLNMTEINAALAKIGGTTLAAKGYWSSTEHSSICAWYVYFSSGSIFYDNKNILYCKVRFIRDISVKPLKERVSDLESKITQLNAILVDADGEADDPAVNEYITSTQLENKLLDKQDTLVSSTNIKTINGESILGSGDIVIEGGSSSGGAYAEVNHGTSDTTFALTSNTFHVWDEVASLDLSFAEETAGVANEYLFQFTSGTTATTLTLPDVKWANDSAPTIAENMIYQISVLKGLASVLSFIYKELILFELTIESTKRTYRVEKGMTWGEFINSTYNDLNLSTIDPIVVCGTHVIVDSNNTNILVTDVIVDNGVYKNQYVEPA